MANPYHGPDGKFTSKGLAEQAYNDAIDVAIENDDFEEVKRLRAEQKGMLEGKDMRQKSEETLTAVKNSIADAHWLTSEEKDEELLRYAEAGTLLNIDALDALRDKVKTNEVRNYITEKIYEIEEETTDGFPYPTETNISKLEGRTAEMVLERMGLPAGVPVQVESSIYYGGYSEYTQENSVDFTVFAGGKTVVFESSERDHERDMGKALGGQSFNGRLSVYGRFQLWLQHKPTPETFDELFPNTEGNIEDGTFTATPDLNHPLWLGLNFINHVGEPANGKIVLLPKTGEGTYHNFRYESNYHDRYQGRSVTNYPKTISIPAEQATLETFKKRFMGLYLARLQREHGDW